MTSGVPLSFGHMRVVDDAVARLVMPGARERALSDPWFANLYLFRKVHEHRFHPGRLPFVSGVAYDGTRYLLPLFDVAQAGRAELLALLSDHASLFPMMQEQLVGLESTRFEWTSRRDDSDYLYDAQRFRGYAGRDLAPKRNLVKQLLAAHAVRVEALVPAFETAALDVLACWMQDKHKAAGEADVQACAEALHHLQPLGLVGRMYFVDGEPAGFLIAQILPDVAFMRFAKAGDRFKGIYQFMFQEFCCALPDLRWVNFEQDLGLPNFRQTKLSYRPHSLVAKYRVRPREQERDPAQG